MKCPKCGLENPEGHAFCANCGTLLTQPKSGAELFTGSGDTPAAPVQQPAPYTDQASYQYQAPQGEPFIPNEYKPITPWGYIGYIILFNLPIAGIILMLICAFGGSQNINVKNFARGMLLVLLISIVIVALAAAVLGPSFYQTINQYS